MKLDSVTVEGVEYRPFDHLYFVSRCGRVLRNLTPHTPRPHPQGYLMCGRSRLLHRMVATVWIRPPKEKEHVHHINYDKTDNRAENLEWVTPAAHITEKHTGSLNIFKHSKMSPEGKARLRQLRLGSKMAEETKRKISATLKAKGHKPPPQTGRKRAYSEIAWMYENHPRRQPCIVDGVRYVSFAAAGNALGVRPLTLRKRCLSDNFPSYQLG